MQVRSSGKKNPGRDLPPMPRQMPKPPRRPIAPPRRIPPKGR